MTMSEPMSQDAPEGAQRLHADLVGFADNASSLAKSRVVAIWSGVMTAALVIYVQTPVAFLWGFAVLAFLILYSTHNSLQAQQSQHSSHWLGGEIAGHLISYGGAVNCTLLPLWIAREGDFAQFNAAILFMAGNAVLIAAVFRGRNREGVSLMIFSAALLCAPLIAGLNDPKGEWGPYLFLMFMTFMFILQLLHSRHIAQQARQAAKTSLEEARRQETVSRMLFDQSSMTISLLDEEFRCVRVNEGFQRWNPGENPIGRSLFEFVPDMAHEPMRRLLQTALQGETIRHEEMESVEEGHTLYLSVEASPWRDHDGSIIGVICFAWDSTENVHGKREVTRGMECLDIALHASNSVVLEHDLQTGGIRWFGDPTLVFGRSYGAEELSGITTGKLNSIYPDSSQAIVRNGIRTARATGKSEFVHQIYMPDGSIGWMQVAVRAVYNEANRPISMIYKSTNITENKHAEDNLLNMLRRAGQSLAAKRSLLTDLTEHGIGLDVDGADADAADGAASATLDNFGEIVSRFNDLLAEVEMRDEALGHAVASLRKAREVSEAANLAKSQFLANMSHELRTPLNAIIGYSEILFEDARDDGRESDMRDLDRVLTAARSLLVLINEILDLSKIEAGRMDIAIGDYNVCHLVEEAVATIRLQAEKNGNTLSIGMDTRLEMGRSDAFKLNQCLLNLLSNASKFTKDGSIEVQADLLKAEKRDWLSISVTDTGIGMSDEQIQRLFQPFAQADASTTREYGGTGLGLVITRRMAQLMGGDISLRSVLGKGSTFTLCVPLNLDANEMPDELESVELTQNSEGPVVLVIDDEANVGDLLQRSLSRLGFRVLAATTASAGLRAAGRVSPALIVLDINLPDRSGWGVLEQLSSGEATKDIPVIVHSIHDDQQRALSLGACAHFVKPTDRDVLAAAVARFARAETAPMTETATSTPTSMIRQAS